MAKMPSNAFGRGRYCVIRQKLCVMIAEALFLRSAARSASEELFFSFRSVLFQLQKRSFSASGAFFFSSRNALFQHHSIRRAEPSRGRQQTAHSQAACCQMKNVCEYILKNEKCVRIYFEKRKQGNILKKGYKKTESSIDL